MSRKQAGYLYGAEKCPKCGYNTLVVLSQFYFGPLSTTWYGATKQETKHEPVGKKCLWCDYKEILPEVKANYEAEQ